MSIRSYVRSTDYHRKSCGENILCGINVSVVMRSTFWTVPFPDIKRQFIDNVTAVSTALRTGKPSVNLHQCPTVPLALVFQLTNQFTPTSIGDRLCKLVILQHVFHGQILDGNRLVFTHQSSCQLVKQIFPGVSNSSLNPGDLTSGLLSIVGTFDSTRQGFLSLSQLVAKTLKVFGISYFLPVTCSNQAGDSRIDSYGFIYLYEGVWGSYSATSIPGGLGVDTWTPPSQL